jgi:hypothetical protein
MRFNYKWELEVVEAGRSEYGIPRVQYLHFIVAVSPDGGRFAHFHAEMNDAPECPPTTARILQRVLRAKPDPRDCPFWEETAPVEGSPAHRRELEAEDEALLSCMEDEHFGMLDSLDSGLRN